MRKRIAVPRLALAIVQMLAYKTKNLSKKTINLSAYLILSITYKSI